METVQMKTGSNNLAEITAEQNAFILSFLAIIWRRVWITSMIYADHNNIAINSNIVLKCLKYNILAETGIGNLIKPFLIKALTSGFLMPKDYENNLYAQRAVKLFGEAYKICKKRDKSKEEELKFVHNYASSVFQQIEPFLADNFKESLDLMADVTKMPPLHNKDIDEALKRLNIRHHCELCELIDLWNIKLELVHNDDPYTNVIMTGLLRCLETNI